MKSDHLPGTKASGKSPSSGNAGPGAGGVVCAVLMPHAPILVPEVGGERGCAASCHAMRAAAKSLMGHFPEKLVLISPHSPQQPEAFGFWEDDPLEGSFAQFDAPQARVGLPLDRPLAEAIATEARARGLETWGIRRQPLDHGALVPLWFLAEAGWAGPTVILGLSYQEGRGLTGLGEAIAAAAHASPGRIAIVASGDMSHRLTADAPCGFHPRAREFDEEFLRLVRSGDYRSIGNIAPGLRGLAAEDAVDSTLVAASAADWQSTGHRVLHYEGPFGVGYGVAILFEAPTLPSPGQNTPGAADGQADGAGLPRLARRSVEDALRGGREQPPAPAGEYLRSKRGVFVTIRHRDGRLRGCVGTFEATTPNVVAETWRNARLAAAEDSRFYPVTDDELDGLRFEVSVIQSPEDASSAVALDPRRYGVIVSTDDGRRGLLLPGIQEIETPGQQLEFAREKGGINPDEPVTIQRFQTDHFEEPA